MATPSAQSYAVVNVVTATDTTLVAAVADQRVRVISFWLWSAGTTNVTFKSASTALHGPVALAAQSHLYKDPRDDEQPWLLTVAGEALVLTTSGAVQVSGIVYYYQY